MTEKEQRILDYLSKHGLLLCNDNKYLPSLFEVGGDWDSIVSLIEKKEVFYCKLYRKRTSYLSKELYFLLKGYKQSILNIPAFSKDIYSFLCENGPADTETLKTTLMLSKENFDKAFAVLLEKMLVTAVQRGKTLNKTWSTFIWGAYTDWEKGVSPISGGENDYSRICELLSTNLTEKEILKFVS